MADTPGGRSFWQIHLSTAFVLMLLAAGFLALNLWSTTVELPGVLTVNTVTKTSVRHIGWPFEALTFTEERVETLTPYEPYERSKDALFDLPPQHHAALGQPLLIEVELSEKVAGSMTYQWKCVDPGDLKIPAPLAVNRSLKFVPRKPGTYTFEVAVTDSAGRVERKQTRVTAHSMNEVAPTFRQSLGDGPRLEQSVHLGLAANGAILLAVLLCVGVVLEYRIRRWRAAPTGKT